MTVTSVLLGGPPAHPDPMQRGVAALKTGRYGDAIAAFGEACALHSDAAEPRVMLNDAYRQLEVNRFLVSKALRQAGFPATAYRGLAAAGDVPPAAEVAARRAGLAARGDDWSRDFRIQLEADRLAMTGEIDAAALRVDEWHGSDATRGHAILGEWHFRRGRLAEAAAHCATAIVGNLPSRLAHELVARTRLYWDRAWEALTHIDFAMMIRDEQWFSFGRIWHPNDYVRCRAVGLADYLPWKVGYGQVWHRATTEPPREPDVLPPQV